MESPIVTVVEGQVRGCQKVNLDGESFYSFLGIPFAKPPLGYLRFKAPVPAEPWSGIRDATIDGNSCYQRNEMTKELEGSEDCLYLNVYTKKLPSECNALKSVMVWIHGGAFVTGSNKSSFYGPEFLITEDIVLVTINYRVGFLGFLHLDDTSLDVPGNAGLKDQQLALKWVQNNIKSFNGDPNNVTIFGESAGSASVHIHVVSPSSKGLFHKAILQSGCLLNPWVFSKDYALTFTKTITDTVMTEKEALEVLKKLPVEELLVFQEKFYASLKGASVIGPNIEKPNKTAVLTSNPTELLTTGQYNKVPLILGYCDREGILLEVYKRFGNKAGSKKEGQEEDVDVKKFLVPGLSEDDPQNKRILKTLVETYKKRATESEKDKYLLPTDFYFVSGIIAAGNVHARTSKCPVYLYRISIDAGLNLLKKITKVTDPGTCHGDELGYLFKNHVAAQFLDKSETEDKVVRRFVKLWTNFAKTGNPTPPANDLQLTWKATDKDCGFIDIGKEVRVGSIPEAERRDCWKVIFQNFPIVVNNL
ncbi:juvenile hormone esterase-like [Diabrotica virgifera virgifera]|uniref:Carboxylesterase type B domain-containing protein n=1 Tax=Diabrotica virgifera virgifera TaxID=50390 RepID=A0ABM5KZQ9_DIAVI|nr:juvenile hormone esterase-like [Diabrotica virgifera virgifera]